MGQFSWVTSNTKQRIIIDGGMPVALVDKNNKLYKEENYQGYGRFGGKDAYELQSAHTATFPSPKAVLSTMLSTV